MKKLLWLSDSPFTNTGYSTISRYICNGLAAKGWEVHYLAHNYVGQTLLPGVTLKDGLRFNFTLYGNGKEAYQKDQMEKRIREIQPDAYGILLDTFMLYPWLPSLHLPTKTFFYFPSDGRNFPIGCENILKCLTTSVAMSKYAQAQVKKDYGIEAEYIPHAIDPRNYYPVPPEEKDRLKANFVVQSVRGEAMRGFLAGKFVVGTVARNQGRKMLDRTVSAFAKFCKARSDAVLFMHSDPFDMAAPFDLLSVVREYGVENRVCFSNMSFFENKELKEMNDVYNVMDVFYLSTSGEGFGVPTIEAMAAEIPVVVTDYTTTQELVMDDGQCGIAVPLAGEIMGNWNVYRAVIDEEKAAEALVTLYDSPALRKEYGRTGRAKVLKNYDWNKVIDEWDNFLVKLTK